MRIACKIMSCGPALRFEECVDEDVVAVELEAVLVVDDDSLAALQAEDEDLVDLLEQQLHLQAQAKSELPLVKELDKTIDSSSSSWPQPTG